MANRFIARTASAVVLLLGLGVTGPTFGNSASEDVSSGIAIGALSVAVVPVAVVVSVPAAVTAGVVSGVGVGLASTGEAIVGALDRGDFDRPLPIAAETLMVGPSPADAVRGGVR